MKEHKHQRRAKTPAKNGTQCLEDCRKFVNSLPKTISAVIKTKVEPTK